LGLQRVSVAWFVAYHVGFIPALKGEAFASKFRNQDDLWEPIRYDNIPNAETVKPTLESNLESDRGVPVAYGVMGYTYNADEVDFQLSSWRDIAEQDVDVDLALPESYFFNTVIMGAIATPEAPMEQELYSDSQRDMIFETLREMPISKFYEGAQDLWTSMSQGGRERGAVLLRVQSQAGRDR